MASKAISRAAAAAARSTARKEQNVKDKYAKQQIEKRAARTAELKKKKEEAEKKKRAVAVAAKAAADAAEAEALAEAIRIAAIERARIAEKEKDGPDADINRHLIDMSIAGEDYETEGMD